MGKSHFLIGHLRILQVQEAQKAIFYILYTYSESLVISVLFLVLPVRKINLVNEDKSMKKLVNYINSKREDA